VDNAPIHTPLTVYELVESTEHKCVYLLPYSPFLNPFEKAWSKVKAGVRRNVLTADDRLSDRICEYVQVVIRIDCQSWIRPAVSFFPMQTKRYQPVRRQKGYSGCYSGVVAMLTTKNKVRSSQ
jgi:hypothetical protein